MGNSDISLGFSETSDEKGQDKDDNHCEVFSTPSMWKLWTHRKKFKSIQDQRKVNVLIRKSNQEQSAGGKH